MKKIPVDQIDSSMVLARDVQAISGNILLHKGIVLNSALGRRLKNWGINYVFVEGEEPQKAHENIPKVSAEEIKSSLIRKFADLSSDPIMNKIMLSAIEYKLKKQENV